MSPTSHLTNAAKTRERWTLILGSFTSFLVGLDALVVTTALPTLHQEFGADVADLSWTINAYALAFAVSILTGSTVGDRFGRRRGFSNAKAKQELGWEPNYPSWRLGFKKEFA